jgi:mannose-6-phosphate isomerase-like protein (cupin superfamily)
MNDRRFLTPTPPHVSHPLGGTVTILVSAADNGGAFGMVEAIMPPQVGPSAHTHSREDETFYVVSGRGEFQLGEKKVICEPGSCIFGPRGVPHGYRNVGDTDLRVLIVYSPGGFENSFRDMADAASSGQGPGNMKAILGRYGVAL